MKRQQLCLLFAALFVGMGLIGCEQSFEPIKQNDQYIFSIYGYLDASADTQWVRVTPAREQLDMPPEIPEMQVTLEHLESGETVVMNDSLFSSDNGANYVNVWTTMEIRNGQTYRLRAERPDRAASQVTVTLPGAYSTPRLRRQINGWGEPITYTLFVDDVDRLAAVQTKWYVRLVAPGFEKDEIFSFSYRNKYEKLYENHYRIYIEPEKDKKEMRTQTLLPSSGEIQVLYRQVFVASGGPDWNEEITGLDDLVYALPGGASNVENGLGYVVGIDSKWIPFESCYEDGLLVGCGEENPYW